MGIGPGGPACLAAAVLLRAALDAQGHLLSVNVDRADERPRLQADARAWFLGPSQGLRFWCSAAELDAEGVCAKARELLAEREPIGEQLASGESRQALALA